MNNEHDIGYKHLLSHKPTFVKLLRSFIKENWVNEIDEENVEYVNKSFILRDFREKEADVVYSLRLRDRNIILYCLLELQSTVDYQMPFRLLTYMIELWKETIKNRDAIAFKENEITQNHFSLPAIVPVVLYNGEGKWTAHRNFKEILDGYELFGDHVLNFNYVLFDVNRYKENELLNIANIISMVFFLDQKKKPEELKDRLKKITAILESISEKEIILFKRWLEMIILPRLPKNYREKAEDIIDKALPGEAKEMVSNLALTIDELVNNSVERAKKEGKEEGKKEGKKEGKREGKREEKLRTAEALLIAGAAVDFVSKITGLNENIVAHIKSTLENNE